MTPPSPEQIANGIINAFNGNKRQNWPRIIIEALREYGEALVKDTRLKERVDVALEMGQGMSKIMDETCAAAVNQTVDLCNKARIIAVNEARRSALEEAAKVADSMDSPRYLGEDIAKEIRALLKEEQK